MVSDDDDDRGDGVSGDVVMRISGNREVMKLVAVVMLVVVIMVMR